METIKPIFDFLTGLGSPVMLPIIIFILGMILGQRPSRAFISALTVGVGFIGLGLVITLLFDALGPATAALVEATAGLASVDERPQRVRRHDRRHQQR